MKLPWVRRSEVALKCMEVTKQAEREHASMSLTCGVRVPVSDVSSLPYGCKGKVIGRGSGTIAVVTPDRDKWEDFDHTQLTPVYE